MAKYTKDMPKDVKVAWSGLIAVLIACGIVCIGIPAVILIIAFPQLLIPILFVVCLLIGGYIHAR